jgi:hypothetical protein
MGRAARAGAFKVAGGWSIHKNESTRVRRLIPLALFVSGALGIGATAAQASVTVPSSPLEAGQALSVQPGLVTGAAWVLRPRLTTSQHERLEEEETEAGKVPSKTFEAPTVALVSTPLLGMPTAGSKFVAFSSGFATHVEMANQTEYNDGVFEDAAGAQVHNESDAVEVEGGAHDLTVLHVAIDVPAGNNCLALDFRFLSQEYPQYVGEYDDGFIVELDSNNWKIRAGNASFDAPANFATDAEGNPLSVNSTGTLSLSPEGAVGSGFEGTTGGEEFGGGTALLSAETPVSAGVHNLYFSSFDAGDHSLDSGAFTDNLRSYKAASCPRGAVPAAEVAEPTPPAAPTATSPPVITGSHVVGQTLTSSTGVFTGEEIVYKYEWLRDGTPITGATEATYTETSADQTHKLSVHVTATNGGGNASQTSAPTAAVEPALPAAPTATSPPVITGAPVVGQTLSSTTGVFAGEEIVYTYEWLRDGTPITGATVSTYTQTGADEGHKLSVRVKATNGGGQATQTSTPTAAIEAPPPGAPTPTTPPLLSGSPQVGNTLTASTGGFTGAENVYTFVWLLDGAPITGATSASYTVKAGDQSHQLSVRVTATNSGGSSSQTSVLTLAVKAAAPSATIEPVAPVATAVAPVASVPVSLALAPLASNSTVVPRCTSVRRFEIHLFPPRGVRLEIAVLTLNGRHAVTLLHDQQTTTLNFTGRLKQTVTLNIRATTTSGGLLHGERVYHTCSTVPLGGSSPHQQI